MPTRRFAWLIFAVALAAASNLLAADGACDRCGCACCPKRVCVPKIVEKEIVKVCWDVKCEEVCVPGPSKKLCTKCGRDKCGCYAYDVWQPTCARVKTRRVPVKTEVKRKVPRIEWTIEYCCDACCQASHAAQPQLPAVENPPHDDPPPTPR